MSWGGGEVSDSGILLGKGNPIMRFDAGWVFFSFSQGGVRSGFLLLG